MSEFRKEDEIDAAFRAWLAARPDDSDIEIEESFRAGCEWMRGLAVRDALQFAGTADESAKHPELGNTAGALAVAAAMRRHVWNIRYHRHPWGDAEGGRKADE